MVNPIGNVIVVDRGNNRLVVLRFDGQVLSHIDSFYADSNPPTSVAVSYSGDLVVADTGNHRIEILDPQGNLLAEYAQPSDGYAGFFNSPRGVVFDQDGNLVVADTDNARVVSVRSSNKIWLSMVFRSTW